MRKPQHQQSSFKNLPNIKTRIRKQRAFPTASMRLVLTNKQLTSLSMGNETEKGLANHNLSANFSQWTV